MLSSKLRKNFERREQQNTKNIKKKQNCFFTLLWKNKKNHFGEINNKILENY